MSAIKMVYNWIYAFTNSHVVKCVTRHLIVSWCSAHVTKLADSAPIVTQHLNIARHLIFTWHLKITWHLIFTRHPKDFLAPKDHSAPIGFPNSALTMARHAWCTRLQCKIWLSVLALKCQNHSKTNIMLWLLILILIIFN